MTSDLTKSDLARLLELCDHGPAVRNAGQGWKLDGWNRRRDVMHKLVRLGFALELGEGRAAQLHITQAGRVRLQAGLAGRRVRAKSQMPLTLSSIELVDGLVKSLPAYDHRFPDGRRDALATVCRGLERKGAVWGRPSGDVTSFRFCGVKSTSTGGQAAALHNWIVAARAKLGPHHSAAVQS